MAYSDEIAQWADEKDAKFAQEHHYRDPVGGSYEGQWLASVERVMVRPEEGAPTDTGLVVLVQEKRDDVLAAVTALEWQLGIGGAVGGLFLVFVLAIVLAATVSVLDGAPKSRVTRVLRRWAGLPTGSGGGTGSSGAGGAPGSAGSGSVSAKTPHVGVAATPAGGTVKESGPGNGHAGSAEPNPPQNPTPRD